MLVEELMSKKKKKKELMSLDKRWKQPKSTPTGEWISKLWYPYSGIPFSIPKEWTTKTQKNISAYTV